MGPKELVTHRRYNFLAIFQISVLNLLLIEVIRFAERQVAETSGPNWTSVVFVWTLPITQTLLSIPNWGDVTASL